MGVDKIVVRQDVTLQLELPAPTQLGTAQKVTVWSGRPTVGLHLSHARRVVNGGGESVVSHRRVGTRHHHRRRGLIACLCGDCAEILEGGVKIIQNKYLSFASRINWLDIVKDGTAADIVIEENGPQSEWEVTPDTTDYQQALSK